MLYFITEYNFVFFRFNRTQKKQNFNVTITIFIQASDIKTTVYKSDMYTVVISQGESIVTLRSFCKNYSP